MCCRKSFVAVLILLTADSVISDGCGQRTALTQLLIHHGNQSHLGEWPWHAAVIHNMSQSSPSYKCGGTIISSSYILTAAHCLYSAAPSKRSLEPREILVRTGITDLQQIEHSSQQTIEKIIIHEDYQMGESDIALLQLAEELEFSDYVKSICLWRDRENEEISMNKLGYVAGWGADEHGKLPNKLKHAVMLIVSSDKCRESDTNYYTKYLYGNKCFCAGFRNGTSPGLGDSGGGLYIEHDGRWILRGIVSNGKFSSDKQLDTSNYIVFTDVVHFLPWLLNKTGLESEDIFQPVRDYSICGKKKEINFSRTRVEKNRMWPWQGNVYKYVQNSTWLCQAAVINENFALSPAEVYDDAEVHDPSRIQVVFKNFYNEKNHPTHPHVIQRIVRHQQFVRVSRINNIALLELKVPLKFSELISPVCLWKTDPAWKRIPISKGYAGEHPVTIYNYRTCMEEFDLEQSKLENNSFCFYVYGVTPMVIPDFLYIKHADSWYLRGISFSMNKNYHIYFIHVLDLAYYSEWIEENAVVESNNLLNLESCGDPLRSYEWMYQLLSGFVFKCYAALIAPTILLTTASCVEEIPINNLVIKTHRQYLKDAVKKINTHPSFDKSQFTNNLAIVELTTSYGGIPVCLPKSSMRLSSLELKILSLSTLQPKQISEQSKTTVSNHIKRTGISSCATRWHREGFQVLTNGQHICGTMIDVKPNGNFDCKATLSGAPLIYNIDKEGSPPESFLRGLLDIGRNNHCDSGSDLPEVFIDVTAYADWISTFAPHRNDRSMATVEEKKNIERTEWRRFEVNVGQDLKGRI